MSIRPPAQYGDYAHHPFTLEKNPVSYLIAGGRLLAGFYGDAETENYASQAWLASTVTSAMGEGTDGFSRLTGSGFFLKDILKASPETFLGEAHAETHGAQPAVLVKLLNSCDRLLVQVHPDGPKAKKYFNAPCGKTEAWYVLDAEPKAVIYAGFKPGITEEVLKNAILRQDSAEILSLLHCFPVQKGDVCFIPPGLAHALGSGSLMLEIQEPSDLTLRAERKRPSGELLDENFLHNGAGTEALLDCFSIKGNSFEQTRKAVFLEPFDAYHGENVRKQMLITHKTTPFFALSSLELKKRGASDAEITVQNDFFTVVLVTGGSGALCAHNAEIPLERGTEVFIPHGVTQYSYTTPDFLDVVECYPPHSGKFHAKDVINGVMESRL